MVEEKIAAQLSLRGSVASRLRSGFFGEHGNTWEARVAITLPLPQALSSLAPPRAASGLRKFAFAARGICCFDAQQTAGPPLRKTTFG